MEGSIHPLFSLYTAIVQTYPKQIQISRGTGQNGTSYICSVQGLDLEYGSMPRDVSTNSELKKTCRRQGGSSSAGPPPYST